MRSLETNFETAIENYNQHLVILVDLEFTSTYRYCNADIDVWYDGNKYTARGLETSSSMFNINMQIDKMSISLDNSDLVLTAIIENQEIRSKQVIIRAASLNDLGKVTAQEVIFLGIIDSANYNNEKATFSVFNIFAFWQRKVPRRKYSPKCQWEFKDAVNCKYSGAQTWCDKTYSRCAALFNQVNFGGFRWISCLIDKDIWWGRTQK